MFIKIGRLFRNITFLISLLVFFLVATLSALGFAYSAGLKTLQLASDVARLTSDVARLTSDVARLTSDASRLRSQASKAALEHRRQLENLKTAQTAKTARLIAENKSRLSKLRIQHRYKVFLMKRKQRVKEVAQSVMHQGALMTAGALHRLSVSRLRVRNEARVTEAVLKAKARARLQRYILAVPVAGGLALAHFERQDYLEWKTDNPDGTLDEYGCLMYTAGQGMVTELQDDASRLIDEAYKKAEGWVPKWLRLKVPDLAGVLPTCADPGQGFAQNE